MNPLKLYKMPRQYFHIIMLLSSFSVWGQKIQSNAWNAWFTDYSLTVSTSIRLETHYRTKDFYNKRDQILIRSGIAYKIASDISISAGHTYLNNNDLSKTVENNIWQQFGFSIPIKFIRFFGWIRTEQRWLNRQNEGIIFGHRIRFRSGFKRPIFAQNKTSNSALIVFNEIFMNFKKGFPYTFNQNWTFWGFEKQLTPKVRLLSGFQRTSLMRTQGYVHKNIWSTFVFFKI